MSVKRSMTISCCGLQTQVIEVLQQVEFALRGIALAIAVVDIDLRVAHHAWMIHIEVVLLILHHFIKIVVVGHG